MLRLIISLVLGTAFAAVPATAQPEPGVHLRIVGEGQSCWVLLHPFGASGRFWERRAPELARTYGVRVVAPDLPSHGRSRLVPHFSYSGATQALRRALHSSCARLALIIGASSGGIVAMKLGAATGAPVVAVGVGWSFSIANLAAMRAEADAPSDGARAFQQAFAEQGQPQATALRRHFGDLSATGSEPFLTRAEIRTLRGRLLIVNGGADDFFLTESAEQLARAVRGSRLQFLPEAGHLGPFAAPHSERLWALVSEVARRR
jgi:pimeloyl-ACP methyl ester carboxylesterase